MTILQALNQYYDRMAARGEVAPPGYSREPITAVLVLSETGELIDVQGWLDSTSRKPRQELVPKWFGRSGKGSTPYFLWDNTAYALGVSSKEEKKENHEKKTPRDHAAFKKLHIDELKGETDIGLVALREFLRAWNPNGFKSPPFDDTMVDRNVAFRLDGEQLLIHQRPAAAVHVEKLRTQEPASERVFCLVTGQYAPVARLHPKIKGVDDTAAAEVPLVSFNNDAFRSYGHEQGDNAPTSEAAAFRYGAALNRLLDRRTSRNRIKIGDTTVAFWADASKAGEQAAAAAETMFNEWFGGTRHSDGKTLEDDEAETARVRDALEAVAKGRPSKDLTPELAKGVRFHVLGLAANVARLSVRYWLEDDFRSFARRLKEHFDDIEIDPAPWRSKLPSVQRLLVKTTALQEKFDNIPSLLAGETIRAILGGGRYPHSLLSAAIMRLRAGDDPGRGWHAAVIRAVLFRDQRLRRRTPDIPEPGEIPMSLKKDHPNKGYQLGRLFAVYELAQRSALGKINASIRDKYFGAASATPASVFPIIVRGAQNHLSKVRKEKPGWAYLIEKELEEIHSRIEPMEPLSLPRSMHLSDQGEFAIGYYHQRAAKLRSDKGGQISFDDVASETEDQGGDE